MNDRVREFLERASKDPVQLSVRDLLAVWGYTSRNSVETVGHILGDLSAADMTCVPSFTEGGLNDHVKVGRPASSDSAEPDASDDEAFTDESLRLPRVAPLIDSIPSAVMRPVSVRPDQTLDYAQGLMVRYDYSQLPVLIGDRELKGAVSWRSIARARIPKHSITLADVIDPHPPVVHSNDNLLDSVATIYSADFVFVRDHDDRICGIVTTADLSTQFRELTAPFFQIGEIEGLLRGRIEQIFPLEEIQEAAKAAKSPKPKSFEDMIFNHYKILLDEPGRWERMGWQIDRGMFIDCLNETRIVRNKIMHFDQDALTPAERAQIVQCLNYVRAMIPRP